MDTRVRGWAGQSGLQAEMQECKLGEPIEVMEMEEKALANLM